MASPVGGGNQGNGTQNLEARIRGWVRDELQKAARGGIGLHLDGATGNLIIDNGDVQSGNYVAGSAGWALAPSGSAELGTTTVRGGVLRSGNYVAGSAGWGLDGAGNAEFNNITLRAGIIGNAALANPVLPVPAQADEGYPTGFTLTALEVAHAIATVTVPSGYTTASVVAISTARGISNTDWNFGMKTRIGSSDGNRTTFGTNTSTNSGGTLSGSCANTATLSSLTAGGTFTISTVMSVNSGTPAVSVTTVAMVWFLR